MDSTENERTYHNDKSSSYSFPNDWKEFLRLQEQHNAVLNIMHDEPVHAPLNEQSPKKIVDLACGVNADMTIWLAKRFPEAKVYGVDISSVLVQEQVPPNVEFIKCNLWDIGTDPRIGLGSVDYLYSRFIGSFMDNWEGYVDLVAHLLSPGGWAEFQDLRRMIWYDVNGKDVARDWKWAQVYEKLRDKRRSAQKVTWGDNKTLMQGAGFVNVGESMYRLPWEVKPGHNETEAWVRYATSIFPTAFVSALIRYFPGEENQQYRRELEKEIWETLGKTKDEWTPVLVVWGQKPT